MAKPIILHQFIAMTKEAKASTAPASQDERENAVMIPREMVRFMGDYEAAAMMVQIFYWTERTADPDGWFYKTAQDWDDELCLSPAQVRRISKVLADKGVEIVFRKNPQHGNAPVYHYRLDWAALTKAYLQFLDIQQCSSSTMLNPDIEGSATSMDIQQSASSLKGSTNLQHQPTTTSLRKTQPSPPAPVPQPPGGGGRKPDRQPRPEPERPNRTETFIFLNEVVGLRDVPTLNKCAGLPLAGVTAEWEALRKRKKDAGPGLLVAIILTEDWRPPTSTTPQLDELAARIKAAQAAAQTDPDPVQRSEYSQLAYALTMKRARIMDGAP